MKVNTNPKKLNLSKYALELEKEDFLLIINLLNKNNYSDLSHQLIQNFNQKNKENIKNRAMSYSQFSLEEVEKIFDLEEVFSNIFPEIKPIACSVALQELLEKNKAIPMKSEKSRCETIISPILVELAHLNHNKFTIFSGESLNVDMKKGLMGECDFILAHQDKSKSFSLKSPIFTIVEAKQHIIENSIGQCVAQMLGQEKKISKKTKRLMLFMAVLPQG